MSKKVFIFLIVCLIILGYALHIKAIDYDSLNFNSRDRVWQPVPTGYTPGKDNSTDPNEVGLHMAGEDCGICHRPDGKAKNYIFTMSGTLYEDRAGTRPLAGGEIVLQDKDGNVISMTSNEVGNFWTHTAIASYPYSVAGYGGAIVKLYTENSDGTIASEADPNDTRTWLYKTWLKKDDQVVYMATVAPIGGASDGASRMSCSMHHSPLGSRGALWLSRKGTLSSYPETGLSFKKHIHPILISRCVPCHIPGETWTRIVMKSDIDTSSDANTKIDHSLKHDLTSYEDQTVTVNSTEWAKYGAGHYAKGYSENPDESPLLAKTTIGRQNHGGGHYWTPEDADYKAIRQWIAEGGQDN